MVVDPWVLLGVAVEGAESVGYERVDLPSKVLLRQNQRVEVGLSWVIVSGRLKGGFHFEYQEDGRGRVLAQILAPAPVRIPVTVTEKGSSV